MTDNERLALIAARQEINAFVAHYEWQIRFAQTKILKIDEALQEEIKDINIIEEMCCQPIEQ